MGVITLALLFLAVGGFTAVFLARKGYGDRDAAPAWIGATLCIVGGFLAMFGYIGEHGIAPGMPDNARQVGTFVSVLATLAAATGGFVWYIRRRPASAGAATKQNYVHAYGTYDAATVRAARAKAAQTRREVRA